MINCSLQVDTSRKKIMIVIFVIFLINSADSRNISSLYPLSFFVLYTSGKLQEIDESFKNLKMCPFRVTKVLALIQIH